jgi:hypothetical protein
MKQANKFAKFFSEVVKLLINQITTLYMIEKKLKFHTGENIPFQVHLFVIFCL